MHSVSVCEDQAVRGTASDQVRDKWSHPHFICMAAS